MVVMKKIHPTQLSISKEKRAEHREPITEKWGNAHTRAQSTLYIYPKGGSGT